jgi:hypothetical protein
MRVNYTWPGRFHLIMHGSLIYVTLWLFKRRMHYMYSNVGARCSGSTSVSKTEGDGSIPSASATVSSGDQSVKQHRGSKE